MKTFISIISLAAALTSVANGFSLTECEPVPAYHNYGSGGNNQCQGLPSGWNGVTSVSYGSKDDCTLILYSEPDCGGETVTLTIPGAPCFVPGWVVNSVKCVVTKAA